MTEIKLVDNAEEARAADDDRVKISVETARLVATIAGQLLVPVAEYNRDIRRVPTDQQIDDAISTALMICASLSKYAEIQGLDVREVR